MATVKLKFRPSSVCDAEGALYYQVIHKRNVKWICSGYRLFPEEWDEKAAVLLAPPEGGRRSQLLLMRSVLDWELRRRRKVIHDLEASRKEITLDELCDAIKRLAPCKTVFAFLQEQVTRQAQMRRQGTARTYGNAFRSFKKFREGTDLIFEDLSSDMMERYEAWLLDRRLKQNSISCYLRTLSTLIHKAADEGWLPDRNLFDHVRLSYVKTTKRAISVNELKAIADLQLSRDSTIAFARDLFMFSFYMLGMPFVDIAFLRKVDLKNGMLTYCRKKTNQCLTVAWEKEQQEIVDRYAHLVEGSPYLLPVIRTADGTEYNQYQCMLENVNRALKKIGEMVGLHVPLTTYVARHTWASIARDMDVNIAVISEGMGHRSLKTTQVYLSSIDTSKINEANRKIIRRITGGI